MKRLYNYQDFILETSKYKSINDTNFLKLFNRIVEFHGETNKDVINTFKKRLYEFLSYDEHKIFKLNFFDKKRKNIKLSSVMHELDNYIAKILIRKGKLEVTNITYEDLKPVWEDKERNVKVYLANSVFESIKLGSGTNFCISSSLDGDNNFFYYYMYSGRYPFEQTSSIYFIKSADNRLEWSTIALDVRKNGTFLYTDVRNDDVLFRSYDDLVNGKSGEITIIENIGDEDNEDDEIERVEVIDYDVTNDLKIIPKDVFKFVEHIIKLEELLVEPNLICYIGKDNLKQVIKDPKIEKEDLVKFVTLSNYKSVQDYKQVMLIKKLFSLAGNDLYITKEIIRMFFKDTDYLTQNLYILEKHISPKKIEYHIALYEYRRYDRNISGKSYNIMRMFKHHKMNNDLYAVMSSIISQSINRDEFMTDAMNKHIKGSAKFKDSDVMAALNEYKEGIKWFYCFTNDMIKIDEYSIKQREKDINEYILPLISELEIIEKNDI